MEEVSFYELGHGQRHGVPSLCSAVREGDCFVRRGDDPPVGDGAASDIAGQIDENAFTVIIPLSNVDVPLGTAQLVLEVGPLLDRHTRRQGYPAILDSGVERGEELPPEYRHGGTNGKKITLLFCSYPSVVMKTAFGDKTMEVGMQDHGLTPRVERCDDTRFCAQVSRVEKELVEGVPHTGKEERGHMPHVQQPQIVQFMRQREDHVIMATGKKSDLLPLQPLRDTNPITLRADPMTTRVVPLPMVVTFRTGLRMSTES